MESRSSLIEDLSTTLSDDPDVPSDMEFYSPSLLSEPSVSEDIVSRAAPDSLLPASLDTISLETTATLDLLPNVPESSLDIPVSPVSPVVPPVSHRRVHFR